jgi:hypothetical protein
MTSAKEMTLEEFVNTLPENHKARKEFKEMQSDVWFLQCLQGAGVDNWDGYGDAQDMYQELGEE